MTNTDEIRKGTKADRPTDEFEITPEMAEAGGAILARRLETANDFLMHELAREIFETMLLSLPSGLSP